MLIGEALRLDVARLLEVLLDEALAATEGGHGFTGRRLEELCDLVSFVCDLQATAASAERRLDRDRETDLVGEGEHLVGVLHRVARAGGERCADLLRDVACRDLVAETLDRVGARPDPGHARIHDGAREIGVLCEEAVPGVHRIGAGTPCDAEDLLDDEVRLAARGAAQRVRFVGELRVHRVPILIRVHRHRSDSAVSSSSNDTDGDLTAVGDEHFTDARHEVQPIRGPGRSLGYIAQTFS